MKEHTLFYYAQKCLLNGERLTHPYFQEKYGSWRVAVPISKLRKKFGWQIETSWVINPETGRDIALYTLPSEEKKRLLKKGAMPSSSRAPKTQKDN